MSGTYHLTDIPVKINGETIGRATVDTHGRVEMNLNPENELVSHLFRGMVEGFIDGLSVAPQFEPALRGADQPTIKAGTDDLIPRRRQQERPQAGRLGRDEILNRFGFHKATVEGPNATAYVHAEIRKMFVGFAATLDVLMPAGRTKNVAFERLEDASMWTHKSVSEKAPIVEE